MKLWKIFFLFFFFWTVFDYFMNQNLKEKWKKNVFYSKQAVIECFYNKTVHSVPFFVFNVFWTENNRSNNKKREREKKRFYSNSLRYIVSQPYLLHSTIGKSVKNVSRANGTKWRWNRAEHTEQQCDSKAIWDVQQTHTHTHRIWNLLWNYLHSITIDFLNQLNFIKEKKFVIKNS